MANTVGTVEYKVEVNKKGLDSGLKSAGSKITKWGNRIGNVVGGLIGFSMFSGAKKGWEDLQGSLRQVSALTEGQANIKELTDLAEDMSSTFGNDAAQSVNAFYQAISAGFSENEAKNLTKIANALAAAGTASGEMTDAKGAINALTTVLNAFGLSAEHASEVSDALTNSVKFGKTSINQLAQSIATVAPTAAAFGVSVNDVLANISALTQAGFDTASATVGINQMLTELSKGSTEAGQALQDNLGFSLGEAVASGMSLTDILQNGLLPSIDGNVQGFTNLFGNIRAAKAAMALANNDFALATKVQGQFKKSIDATGKGAKAFVNNPLTKFHNGLNSVKNTLVGMIDMVGGLGNAIVIFGAILSAFKIAGFIAKTATMIASLSGVAVAKAAAQTGVGAVAAVPAVIGAISAGIAAVGAIAGTITAGVLFNKDSSGSIGSSPTNNVNNNNTTIQVNVSPSGSDATSNNGSVNVQTNYGS